MLTERSVYEEAVYELGVSEICFAIVFVSLGKIQYILRSKDPHRFLVWSEIRRAIQNLRSVWNEFLVARNSLPQTTTIIGYVPMLSLSGLVRLMGNGD